MAKYSENGLGYLFYAIERFGFFGGVSRWWEFHGSPVAWYRHAKEAYRDYKLIDRRPKYKYGSLRVYAVDRDGDLYIIECPQCHQMQRLSCYRKYKDTGEILGEGKTDPTTIPREERCCFCYNPYTHFHCHTCAIGFSMYLEDGLRELLDFREGNPPLPTHVVRAPESKTQYLGLEKDAPWWWTKREVYKDLHDGKDGHGHKPYESWACPPELSTMGGQAGTCKAESPGPQKEADA